MTDLRTDSYSSQAEVTAFTRHLLHGQSAFNTTTRPTEVELVKFIDRASGVLNVALAAQGLTTPITNSTAKLMCSDWVTAQASMYVEMTQRGTGFSAGEDSRVSYFRGLHERATEFAKQSALGFVRLGVVQTTKKSAGLLFTGETLQSDRADPDDSTLEQPLFTRKQFDTAEDV